MQPELGGFVAKHADRPLSTGPFGAKPGAARTITSNPGGAYLLGALKASGPVNLAILRPSRKRLVTGDVFVMLPSDDRYLFGRVISTTAQWGAGPSVVANLVLRVQSPIQHQDPSGTIRAPRGSPPLCPACHQSTSVVQGILRNDRPSTAGRRRGLEAALLRVQWSLLRRQGP